MSNPGWTELGCRRFDGQNAEENRDSVVVEEPLELRINSTPLATVMRTPGDDRELALGFCFAEGVISGLADVATLVVCGQAGPITSTSQPTASTAPGWGNVIDLKTAPHVPQPTVDSHRLPAMSSCGVCGKRTIDDVLALAPPLQEPENGRGDATQPAISSAQLTRLPELLLEQQKLFHRTGALHGAGLFSPTGTLYGCREDVGRHNAVDKVIGEALLSRQLTLPECILQVSGRVSFEIVQKAYRARIPIIAAVSGVSSLAAALAQRADITLIGFLRRTSFNVYSCPERITR